MKGQRPGTFVRGGGSPWGGHGGRLALAACILTLISPARADTPPPTSTITDPQPRTAPPAVAPERRDGTPPSWDLDGLYLWLGPTIAASRIDGAWDSTIGGHAAVIRVRERALLGTVGGVLGGSLWTERPGGRLWLDSLLGTRVGGRMIGVSIGPIVELGSLSHPRPGGSVGLWAFVGVTPFVRAGFVDELGAFAEIGVHLALPVLRR